MKKEWLVTDTDREVKERGRERERWTELLNKRVEVFRNVSL